MAAGLLLFGFAALAPFLWASAMRFRLGATRWRGIRLRLHRKLERGLHRQLAGVCHRGAIWTALFFVAAALAPDMPLGVAEEPGSVSGCPALAAARWRWACLVVC